MDDKLARFNNFLKLSGDYDDTGHNASGKITMLYIDAPVETYHVTDYLGGECDIQSGNCIFAQGASFRMSEPPGYSAFRAAFCITEKIPKIRNGVHIT